MAYACVQDIASSWQHYQLYATEYVDPRPAGLIVHAAGPTDEGVRIIEIWHSEHDRLRFQTERLIPAIAVLDGPPGPPPVLRDVHPAHLVIGTLDNQHSHTATTPLTDTQS
jgi:hypothetical protein